MSSTIKKALGGAIRKATGKAVGAAVQPPSSPAKGGGLRGALSRAVSRIAPQGQKTPPVKGNHMVRNAGPIQNPNQELLRSSDQMISETGDGLRKAIGRIGSRGRVAAARGGKIKKYAEGGKVGTAMSALQALAKKYQSALDSGDQVLARRIKRELELKKKSESIDEEPAADRKAREDKLATFAKGGKVSLAAGLRKHPMWSRSDYKHLKGKGYSDDEVKSLWDRDRDAGRDPVEHKKVPDVVGYLSGESK